MSDLRPAAGLDGEVTHDTLLGGRVRFAQPAAGYRVAIDPILLAASVTAPRNGRAVELGCGAGAALLCLATRRPDLQLVGVEIDAASAELARRNVAANRLTDRVEIVVADVRRPPASLDPGSFDAVLANPPYLTDARADPSTAHAKRRATIGAEGELGAWVGSAIALLRRKGALTFIQRADRLDDLLAALHGIAGEIVVFALWPKAGEAARRVIVRARKGLKSPLRLAAGLVLHEADGSYSDAARRILRDGAAIEL